MKLKRILVLASIMMLAIITACNGGTKKNVSGNNVVSGGGKLSVEEFDAKLMATTNPQLIDVRTEEEYKQGHLAGAKLMSLNGDFENQVATLDKTKPVFVYCLSGGRSSSAASYLKQNGFTEVYEMPGVMAWSSAGKELVTNEPAAVSSNALTVDGYNKLVSEPGYTLVDFSAVWCKPCQIVGPMVEKLAEEYKGKLNLRKLDADEQIELCKAKGIDGIPYLELYKDGKLIWSHQGLVDENEIRKQIK